jgi:AcrR family transcriptional regulator
MPRPSRFSVAQILDATAAIVAANGPGAATIGAIGNMLKAPSGSIYHRFASRDVLLGRLWLSKAAFFQNRFAAAFADPDPAKAGLAAALSMPRAVRDDFAGARIMLLHRRDDFLDGDWPPDMAAEAIRLKHQADDAINEIAHRLFGPVSAETLRLVNFAIIDVPLAAVRRHVAVNELPPPSVEDLISRTYAALIAPARRRTRGKKSAQRSTEKRT